jgi:hypothetical protein
MSTLTHLTQLYLGPRMPGIARHAFTPNNTYVGNVKN